MVPWSDRVFERRPRRSLERRCDLASDRRRIRRTPRVAFVAEPPQTTAPIRWASRL